MDDILVKGMILAAAPQGEYGRRLTVLTDRLGKITVFASGGAKAGSKLIGKIRPFTSAEFTLVKGKGAYNIHGAEVMDSFDEISLDPDVALQGYYVLELTDYFSREGMPEYEAKDLLNLSFMTLSALRKKELSENLACRILELRLLKLQGEYTEKPPHSENASESDETAKLWSYILSAPLQRLFDKEVFKDKDTGRLEENIAFLFKKQVPKKFKSLQILHEL